MTALDEIDRRIVGVTQQGLPLVAEPYAEIARAIGISADDVLARFRRLLETGAIRRIGAVPNHYALGYRANGMSVWDVEDERVDEVGRRIGALDFVSHCYQRPRHEPIWRFNLFAMVHDKTREAVIEKVETIAGLIGPAARARDILFSTRVLKKTGLRVGVA